MTTPTEVTWEIELHTRAKHEILKRYLQAWFPIMTKGNGRVIVLDGFAGPGIYKDSSDGSPVIAIETLLESPMAIVYPSEKVFYFIEADAARYDHLRTLLDTRFGGRKLHNITWATVNGKFDEHMTQILDDLDENASALAPTFAFLDPFGYSHTPMSVVSRLMKHAKCEVLINFMYEEINRFMAWENPSNDAHYDGLFGTRDWRAIRAKPLTPAERERQLHDLYLSQLRTAGGATYVRSFRMRNKSKRTDYYLFFGTKSLTGLDKMKDAMWKVDRTGAYDFSDATNPDQMVLFESEPDFGQLSEILRQAFSGKTVTVQDIKDYVVAYTPYTSSHFRRALKPLEKAGKLIIVRAPAHRRAGSFSDMAMQVRIL